MDTLAAVVAIVVGLVVLWFRFELLREVRELRRELSHLLPIEPPAEPPDHDAPG